MINQYNPNILVGLLNNMKLLVKVKLTHLPSFSNIRRLDDITDDVIRTYSYKVYYKTVETPVME